MAAAYGEVVMGRGGGAVAIASALAVTAMGIVSIGSDGPTFALADRAPLGVAGVATPRVQVSPHRLPRRRSSAHRQHTAWVRATVATVWIHPRRARLVDRLALSQHPDITGWIRAQTLAQREDLDRRVMTQSPRGDRVDVLRQQRAWSKVRLPQQRGSMFPHGIVGWVPTRQLSASTVRVTTPHYTARPSAANALRAARGYLGVRYLWGGLSHRGIDCSGLTYLVYHRLGITLPRDAADQSRHGRAVGRAHLRPGDLVFFGPGGWRTIHHVGIYAGHGLVLHAPHTGSSVRITALRAWPDYWGARRLV
jgi:cell wall-associated NlpC family hydrolase